MSGGATIWLGQHRAALRIALRRLASAPINTFLSMLAIGIALAFPVGGVMLFSSAQQLVHGTTALPQISLFMKLDAEKSVVADIDKQLRLHPAVESVRFLSREDTLANMRESEGLAEVIDALPRNPFPDAFIITPRDTGADEMDTLAEELEQWKQVDHVQIDTAWVKRLNAMLSLGRIALITLSAMLGAGLVAITFNTIRLQTITLKNEIEVSRLLGATNGYISRPFFYFGVLQGILGGLVAWCILACITLAVRVPVQQLAALYGLDIALSLPNAGATAILLTAAGGLGWLGTWLLLMQHLRRSAI